PPDAASRPASTAAEPAGQHPMPRFGTPQALLLRPDQPRRRGIRTGPDVGSTEGDALQPEVQQSGLAEHLDALTVGGQPTVEHPHNVSDRSAQRSGGLTVT